jgi:hypothetical protein
MCADSPVSQVIPEGLQKPDRHPKVYSRASAGRSEGPCVLSWPQRFRGFEYLTGNLFDSASVQF